ncbi:class I SAM-dependent methyltransferase [Novimethylophilus kurashikiensis]|uniref:class I SAM-dependent methyltransferase n=1 Tax=Novimethylophilus kurashikiensis TaxID=1825523 RepID=UPI000D596A39|nr:class I SAM-dependent methyltransferase [Novimethylophilus kurashikiensis]
MPRFLLSLPPIATALLAQFVSFVLVLWLKHHFHLPLTTLQLGFVCGSCAAVLGAAAQLPFWWVPIQILFIPVVFAASQLELPSWAYLAGFVLLLVIYWSAYQSRVPLYLTSNKAWTALETLLPAPQPRQSITFIDVGCGLGGVLTHLASARPDGFFYGIEHAPLPFFMSWLRIKLARQANCQVTWGSFWRVDLNRYDVVYAYLSPVPMPTLWQKAKNEMRPGSVLISNTFDIPGHPPHQIVQVDDLHKSKLYLWRF